MLRRKNNRAVALIIAITIMAVLAVIGFGFASSMKLESSTTTVMKNFAQARLAALAGARYLTTVLITDAITEYSSTTGLIADHTGEPMFSSGVSKTLLYWGDIQIVTQNEPMDSYDGPVVMRDEGGKLNINAAGNISKMKFYPAPTMYNDNTLPAVPGVLSSAVAGLYQGTNMRVSSYELSIEDFLYKYYQDGRLWGTGDPYSLVGDANKDVKARVRCANLARAICLYRYGGNSGDGRPGVAGVDDNKNHLLNSNGIDDDGDGTADNAPEASYGYRYDQIDNDGDGTVDETNEGFDEPDEYNPYALKGDDKKFSALSDLVTVWSQTTQVSGSYYDETSPTPVSRAYNFTCPAPTNYSGLMSAAAISAEAQRVFNIVQSELTISSYNLGVLSASIDDPGTDGYDNDGDGLVDQSDATGVSDVAGLVAQINAGTLIEKVNINEKQISKAAQAVYLYYKMNRQVTYSKLDGSPATPQPLVQGFTLQNALDAVDYRDVDCIPTKLPANSLAAGSPAVDLYGFEGLHITEVGRFLRDGSTASGGIGIVSGSGWTTGDNTVTTSTSGSTATFRIPASTTDTNLKDGSYMLKVNVTSLPGTLTIANVPQTVTKSLAAGVNYFGPITISGGVQYAQFTLTATGAGTFTLGTSAPNAGVALVLPYIEIINMSQVSRDMSMFDIKLGSGAAVSLSGGTVTAPTTWANTSNTAPNVPPASGWYVDRLRKTPPGRFDVTTKHGCYYGHYVIAYDLNSFKNLYAATVGTVDFPIMTLPALFGSGATTVPFDGTQNIQLFMKGTTTLVAGGDVDRFSATTGTFPAAGTCFNSSNVSRFITNPVGNKATATPFTASTSWLPGRYIKGGNWISIDTALNADDTDIPNTADRGFFRSPMEITRLEVQDRPSATLSLFCLDRSDWGPDLRQLPGYVTVGRAPARININTASAPVMAAAFATESTTPLQPASPLPSATMLRAGRPYTAWAWLQPPSTSTSYRRSISGCWFDTGAAIVQDDDGFNSGNNANEKLLWDIQYSNVFTLNSFVFSVSVEGRVQTGLDTLLGTCSYVGMYDRGYAVTAEGRPVIRQLSLRLNE